MKKRNPKFDCFVKHKVTGYVTKLPYNRFDEDLNVAEIKADVELKHSHFIYQGVDEVK